MPAYNRGQAVAHSWANGKSLVIDRPDTFCGIALNPQITGRVIRALAQIKLAQRHRSLNVVGTVAPTAEIKCFMAWNLTKIGV